jgi:hypothetical protein
MIQLLSTALMSHICVWDTPVLNLGLSRSPSWLTREDYLEMGHE